MSKIFRVGHHNFRNGVITIASSINKDDEKIWYGVSFCSPKEQKYIKALGKKIAEEHLILTIANDEYIQLPELVTHKEIVKAILNDILWESDHVVDSCNYPAIPKWVPSLIKEQLNYPTKLLKFKAKNYAFAADKIIEEVVVTDELAKEQLILAIDYLKSLCDENVREFIAVDFLFSSAFKSAIRVSK